MRSIYVNDLRVPKNMKGASCLTLAKNQLSLLCILAPSILTSCIRAAVIGVIRVVAAQLAIRQLLTSFLLQGRHAHRLTAAAAAVGVLRALHIFDGSKHQVGRPLCGFVGGGAVTTAVTEAAGAIGHLCICGHMVSDQVVSIRVTGSVACWAYKGMHVLADSERMVQSDERPACCAQGAAGTWNLAYSIALSVHHKCRTVAEDHDAAPHTLQVNRRTHILCAQPGTSHAVPLQLTIHTSRYTVPLY